jgi:hypothetical protein
MHKIITAAILTATLSSPLTLHAETSFGIGVSYIFGEGIAVSGKVFADDEEYQVGAAAGIDYMLKTGAWRPNMGVAYIGDHNYGDLNVGYNLKNKAIDFGVGVGYTNAQKEKEAAIPTPAPAPTIVPEEPAPKPEPEPENCFCT